MRKIGIIAKRHHPEMGPILQELLEWLKQRSVEVVLDEESAALIKSPSLRAVERWRLPALVEMIAVFGGDGTLLSVARLTGDHQPIIFGVNLGSLGFLTEITLADLYQALEATISGTYEIDTRQMLVAGVERGGFTIARYLALNDAVINKGALARVTDLQVCIDDHFVSTFKADGLIIASPTGSTAYSLAAGGPIVYPSMEAFVITPICPHTLTYRPLVVSDKSVITVRLESGHDVMLTIDGQVGFPLETGDVLRVNKSDKPLTLVRPLRRNWFEILRRKLKWGER
ncbi:MAG: NAD(+)/NADH kinase [Acidobacteria bacterium]|nr:NAD(+)/NADH kinase [Acidobacteriota bacterium]MBI3657301.1 NAD(+)/NADH kinase [Acidobacteriota bacterium]